MYLERYRRRSDSAYDVQCRQTIQVSVAPFLAPAMFKEANEYLLGIWTGTDYELSGATRTMWRYDPEADTFCTALAPTQALLLPSIHGSSWPDVLLFDNTGAWCIRIKTRQRIELGWQPALIPSCGMYQAPLSWHQSDTLELVALDGDGVLRWACLSFYTNGPLVLANTAWSEDGPCLAAALVRPGLAVALSHTGIVWLRRKGHTIAVVGRTLPRLPNPVACFASLPTHEVLIVCDDGTLARIRVPV
jgi:hypothetical protein